MTNPEDKLFPANTTVPGVVIGRVAYSPDYIAKHPQVVTYTIPIDGPRESTGEQLRDKGMSEAERAAQETWKHRVRLQIGIWADTGVEFTAEEIRDVVGDPPDHGNAMGSLFNIAARKRRIEKVGYRPAKRPGAHARALAVWRGVER